jgi:hypothetical protein
MRSFMDAGHKPVWEIERMGQPIAVIHALHSIPLKGAKPAVGEAKAA